MPNSPIEPPADLRTFAAFAFGLFTALTQEGFTEHQAVMIIGQFIAVNLGNQDGAPS